MSSAGRVLAKVRDPLIAQRRRRRRHGFYFEKYAALLLDRRHRHIRDSAGSDRVEGREIAPHVQREAMHCDPMADTDADGGDLAFADPDPRQAGTRPRFDLEGSEQRDQERFNPTQIAMQILPVMAQVEEKITDQLPRAVISRLATPIDMEKWVRKMIRAPQTRLIGRPPDGVNRFVLEKEELVPPLRLRAFSSQNFLLEEKGIGEGNLA